MIYIYQSTVFLILGELLDELSSYIVEYIERSSLRNPYSEKDVIWRWAYMIYEHRKAKRINTHKSRAISFNTNLFRAIKSESMPKYYSDKKNVDLEDKVPKWDISFQDLVTFYDKARFEKYLDWELDEVVSGQCSKRQLKRRITWLYPEDGSLFSSYFVYFIFSLKSIQNIL